MLPYPLIFLRINGINKVRRMDRKDIAVIGL